MDKFRNFTKLGIFFSILFSGSLMAVKRNFDGKYLRNFTFFNFFFNETWLTFRFFIFFFCRYRSPISDNGETGNSHKCSETSFFLIFFNIRLLFFSLGPVDNFSKIGKLFFYYRFLNKMTINVLFFSFVNNRFF